MRSSLYLTEWHNCRRASVTAGTNGAGWQAPVTDSAIETRAGALFASDRGGSRTGAGRSCGDPTSDSQHRSFDRKIAPY